MIGMNTTALESPAVASRRIPLSAPTSAPDGTAPPPQQEIESFRDLAWLTYKDAFIPDSAASLGYVLRDWHWNKGNTQSSMETKGELSGKEQWPEFIVKAGIAGANPERYLKIKRGWIAMEVPEPLRSAGMTQRDYVAWMKSNYGIDLSVARSPDKTSYEDGPAGRDARSARDAVAPTPSAPLFMTQSSELDNVTLAGLEEGFLAAVDALLNAHKARMGIFQSFYELMTREAKIATEAAKYATEVQRLIAGIKDENARKSLPDDAMNAFVREHIGKEYAGKPLDKGELEALRDHLNNLASAKKSDNEKLMLKQNELASFLTSMITLATNILKMFNEMRSAITNNLRN